MYLYLLILMTVAAFGQLFVLLSEKEASHQTDPDFSRENILRVKCRIEEECKEKKKKESY